MGKVRPDHAGRLKGKFGNTVYYMLGQDNIGRMNCFDPRISNSDESTRVKNLFKERISWSTATLEASKLGFPQATVNMSAGNLFMAENKDRFTQEDLSWISRRCNSRKGDWKNPKSITRTRKPAIR